MIEMTEPQTTITILFIFLLITIEVFHSNLKKKKKTGKERKDDTNDAERWQH